MTELQIERARYAELLRVGKDTRALTALFWWATPASGDYRKVQLQEINVCDEPLGHPGSNAQPATEEIPAIGELEEESDFGDIHEPGLSEIPGEPELSGNEPLGQQPSLLTFEVEGAHFGVTEDDHHRIQRATQVPMEELKVAMRHAREYRWDRGLLQRHIYNPQTGMYEWYTVVPDGGWKSVEFQGKTRRVGLRHYDGTS